MQLQDKGCVKIPTADKCVRCRVGQIYRYLFRTLNSLASGKSECDLKNLILLILFCRFLSSDVFMIMPSDACQHTLLLIINLHWFGEWLGATRQQAITWAKVGPHQCLHMASLGHNELSLNNLLSTRYRVTDFIQSRYISCRLFFSLYFILGHISFRVTSLIVVQSHYCPVPVT